MRSEDVFLGCFVNELTAGFLKKKKKKDTENNSDQTLFYPNYTYFLGNSQEKTKYRKGFYLKLAHILPDSGYTYAPEV